MGSRNAVGGVFPSVCAVWRLRLASVALAAGLLSCGGEPPRGIICQDLSEPFDCERAAFPTTGECSSSPCDGWELERMLDWHICLCVDGRSPAMCDQMQLSESLSAACATSSTLSDAN